MTQPAPTRRLRPDRYKRREEAPVSRVGDERECEDCGRSYTETEVEPEKRLCPRCRDQD